MQIATDLQMDMETSEGAAIFIVEDENIVALDIRQCLERLGYRVLGTAGSGERAIEAVTELKPDLVLMDIRLRGEMDGIEAAEAIRTALHLPVVYLTAYADTKTLTRAKVTEPYGYVLKPFEERELHTVIEMALYKHQIEERLRISEERYRDLFEEAQLALLKSELHNQINRSLISSRSMDEVLYAIVDGVGQAMTISGAYLHIIDSEKVQIVRSVGPSSRHRNGERSLLDATEIWHEIVTTVANDKRPLLIRSRAGRSSRHDPIVVEAKGKSFAKWSGALRRYQIDTLVCVPIIFRGRLLGILAGSSQEDEKLDNREIELMMVIANQAAVAVENARLFEEAERRAKELSRSNQELEQFAYVASHDLQEPLRMIRSYTQLLERRLPSDDEQVNEFIGYVLDGTERMHSLIHDLLAYSRIGTDYSRREPVDLEQVLERSLASLRTQISDSGGRVTHDPLPTLAVDPTAFGQVLQNLISNGLKFRGDREPHIHVGTEKRSDCWLFTVSDNGIGIPPEHQEEIFMVFRRLHTQKEFPGTGIGLAICKKIVESYGGQIWLESVPDEGSIFYFSICAEV